MAMDLTASVASLRVDPAGSSAWSRATDDTLGWDRADAARATEELMAELGVWQNRLAAEGRRSLLLVLQGMDASGKDGVIRRVFSGVNPQGCRVVAFKAPSAQESAHDFLWRIHAALPRRGEIGIFNRSHYEDLVTQEVLGLIDRGRRERRTGHVAAFEAMLADEGTALVKVFLHVGRDEQRSRLQDRVDDPEKRWKFNPDDLDARARWDDYHAGYDAVLRATSTDEAPWFVVPADRKWVRDRAVAELVVAGLRALGPRLPQPEGIEGTIVP